MMQLMQDPANQIETIHVPTRLVQQYITSWQGDKKKNSIIFFQEYARPSIFLLKAKFRV
jgi:hypothetical protein